MFLQGCAGDQNPYRDRNCYEQVIANGTMAAHAVLEALLGKKAVNSIPLLYTQVDVNVPITGDRSWPVGICGLRIGDAVVVGLEGEPFVEYAHYIRRHAAAASAFTLGYTNGAAGYLCTEKTNEEGGYEATANKAFSVRAPWTSEIEKVLKNGILNVIIQLNCWKDAVSDTACK